MCLPFDRGKPHAAILFLKPLIFQTLPAWMKYVNMINAYPKVIRVRNSGSLKKMLNTSNVVVKISSNDFTLESP